MSNRIVVICEVAEWLVDAGHILTDVFLSSLNVVFPLLTGGVLVEFLFDLGDFIFEPARFCDLVGFLFFFLAWFFSRFFC